MKLSKSQSGSSHLILILIIVLIVGLGFAGWRVYTVTKENQKLKNNTLNSSPKTKTESIKENRYTFEELGISMNLLPGWEVHKTTKPSETGDETDVNWVISKAGADGEIYVTSWTFQGGFETCGLTDVNVEDVSPTQNPEFLFLQYGHRTIIAKADEEVFKTQNKENAPAIKNSQLTKGKYYYCEQYPGPGWDISSKTKTHKDGIGGTSANDEESQGLEKTAKSYADIKTMLTSVK